MRAYGFESLYVSNQVNKTIPKQQLIIYCSVFNFYCLNAGF